mmetsp:Transcript_27049/g.77619  ORF Transcript_27049/g.77619 Transcript_27049/m.77619 type:complete len:268 (-) Transcript_27049:767-1570(-)
MHRRASLGCWPRGAISPPVAPANARLAGSGAVLRRSRWSGPAVPCPPPASRAALALLRSPAPGSEPHDRQAEKAHSGAGREGDAGGQRPRHIPLLPALPTQPRVRPRGHRQAVCPRRRLRTPPLQKHRPAEGGRGGSGGRHRRRRRQRPPGQLGSRGTALPPMRGAHAEAPHHERRRLRSPRNHPNAVNSLCRSALLAAPEDLAPAHQRHALIGAAAGASGWDGAAGLPRSFQVPPKLQLGALQRVLQFCVCLGPEVEASHAQHQDL